MRRVRTAVACMALMAQVSFGQSTFAVTGTSVPSGLLRENYGALPKGISAYDLSICNLTGEKQPLLSSQIYQALVESNPDVQPIGRQILLAAILRNQGRSAINIVGVALGSITGVVAVLGASKYGVPTQWATGLAIASLAGQPILNALKPVMSADQLQKFDNQVLESALVLDGGSCAEKTVFSVASSKKERVARLSFHVR